MTKQQSLLHLKRALLAFACLYSAKSGASVESIYRCESIFNAPLEYSQSSVTMNQTWQWREEIRQLLKIETMSAKDFDQIAKAVQRLNETEKAALLNKISTIYRDVTFVKYKDVKIKNFKRILDLIVSRAIDPQSIFQNAKLEGKNAHEAFDFYISESLRATGILNKYNASDVKNLAQFVQTSLREEAKSNLDAAFWNITIYGSVFNGRAIKNISDVDSLGEYKSQNRFIERLGEKFSFNRFELDHFSANSMNKFSQLNAAQINPVMIVVSVDKIELRVYPAVTVEEIKNKKLYEHKTYLSFEF